MLPIYFPTDIKLGKEPIWTSVDFNVRRDLDVRTNPSNQKTRARWDSSIKAKKGLLTYGEENPTVIMATNSVLLPLDLCVVSIEPRIGNGGIGLDPKENELTPLMKGFTPNKYSGCFNYEQINELDAIIYSLFARATGFNVPTTLAAPSTQFVFGSEVGRFGYAYSMINEKSTGYVLDNDKIWYRFIESNLFDIKTGKLVHEDVDVTKKPAVLYERPNHCIDIGNNPFTFKSVKACNNQYFADAGTLVFKCDTGPTDPDFGKTFFDRLGIQYDIYDDVSYTEDNKVDTAFMLDGIHDFAVMKRNMWVIDPDGVSALIKDAVEYVDSLGLSEFAADDEDMFDFRPMIQNAGDVVSFAVSSELELTENVIGRLAMHHRLDGIVNYIAKSFKGKLSTFAGLSTKTELHTRRPWACKTDLSKEEYVYVFGRILKKTYTYLPIATPRFSNEVCGYLQAFANYSGHMTDALGIDNEYQIF